jgi:hypothetical protein
MSTSATSPNQIEEEPRTNRWLKYIGEEDAALPADKAPVESAPNGPRSAVDFDRVERLINDLEARSMALAKYAYARSPQPSRPASHKLALIAVLLALWLSVLAFCFVYVRFTSGKQPSDHVSLSGKRIISPMHPREERKAASSLEDLTKTLASSSRKLSQLEAEVERSKKGLQRMASPAAAELPDAATTSGAPQAGSCLPPSDLAIAHKTPEGIVDYWLMPRGPRGTSPAKVVCVGKVASGIVVRNLADNRYYTVSPTGEWRAIRKRF